MAQTESPASYVQFVLTDPAALEHMNNSATNYGFAVDVQSGITGLESTATIVTVKPTDKISSFANFFHGIVLSQEYTQLFDLAENSTNEEQIPQLEASPQLTTPVELPKRRNIFHRRIHRNPRLRTAA